MSSDFLTNDDEVWLIRQKKANFIV